MCSSDYHYAHRAHIETLLNFIADRKKDELTAAFWCQDTPNHFDTLGPANVNYTMCKQLPVNRRVLMGSVHADLFAQGCYMIDGMAVHVKLIRSPSSFSLMCAATDI